MNICYLINQYPKVSHTFIRREIQALERLGAKVSRVTVRGVDEGIVSEEDKAELDKTVCIIGASTLQSLIFLVICVLLSITRLPKVLRLWAKLSSAANGTYVKHFIYVMEACWLLRFCRKNDIHHVHAHFGTNPAAVALFCHVLGGPEYSFTVHGPEEFDSPLALSLRDKIHYSKFTVAITAYCTSQLYRWADFNDWPKMVEVHCAVDEALLLEGSPSFDNPYRLVSIGRLCEQKGQWLLLQAVAELVVTYPHIELHLIGDGELKEALQAYVAAHHLENNVIFYGWQGESAIKTQLDAAKAMILPSFAEGLPVVIMEAFARKKPVVSTFIAGIPELVNQDNGWLIPAGSVNHLVAAIESVLVMPNERLAQKGEHGYKAIQERHSADAQAYTLYQKMGGL